MDVSSLVVIVIVFGIFSYGLLKRVDLFSAFCEGAADNIKTAVGLLPTLTFLILGVSMFRASGALEALTNLAKPLTERIGFPAECLPLALLRPISGSGALSILESILSHSGADSFAGRVASVLMGSTETTFYTAAIYFAATRVKNTRHALIAALAGDMTAFLLSALAVKLFLS